MSMSRALQPPLGDTLPPEGTLDATGDTPLALKSESAGDETIMVLQAEWARLGDALASVQHLVERLEIEREFLIAHSKNLERELRLSRRLARTNRTDAVVAPQPFTDPAAHWRRKYEEIVASRSWRLMWWIGTPYRAWVTRRRRRVL